MKKSGLPAYRLGGLPVRPPPLVDRNPDFSADRHPTPRKRDCDPGWVKLLAEIRYGLATHYHIDHAGLGQDLKMAGVPLLAVDVQEDAIPLMKQWTKPQDNYTEITPEGNVIISTAESRDFLAEIGIAGEIVHTPGHSDDSVSLLLDNGAVFTGDLTPPALVGVEDPAVIEASWRRLGERGARRVYPGHGPVWEMDPAFLS
jgi:glyoxylase-like metal-dependent hydrolase (beta-lactamase superfamily II)